MPHVDILIIKQCLKIRVTKQAQNLTLLIKISFLKHLFNSHYTLWELHGTSVLWESGLDFTQAQKTKKKSYWGNRAVTVQSCSYCKTTGFSWFQCCLLYCACKGPICDVDVCSICSLGAILFLWELDKDKWLLSYRSLSKHFWHLKL